MCLSVCAPLCVDAKICVCASVFWLEMLLLCGFAFDLKTQASWQYAMECLYFYLCCYKGRDIRTERQKDWDLKSSEEASFH